MYYAAFAMIYFLTSIIYNFEPKKIHLWFFVFIIFLFSGFRYNAGYDYFFYLEMVQGIRPSFMIEVASQFFMSIAYWLNYFQFFFIINSFIYVYCTAIALRNFSSLSLISIMLWCFAPLSLLTSFGLVRQYTAISLIFLSFSFFYNRRIFFSVLLLVLASLFHKSALFLVCIYLLKKSLIKPKHSFTYLSLIVLSYFVLPKIAFYVSDYFGLYQHYFELENQDGGKKIMFLLMILFLINQYFASLKKIESSSFWFSHNLFFLGICIYFGLSQFGEHVARVSYYLIPFLYVATHKIYFLTNGKNRFLYLLILIAFCSIGYIGTLYFSAQHISRDAFNNYQLSFLINII